MQTHRKNSTPFLPLTAGLVVALLLQPGAHAAPSPTKPAAKLPASTKPLPRSTASAAPEKERSIDELVAAAKASPLFRREVKAAALAEHGLQRLELSPGVEMDAAQYLRETRLDRKAELALLMDPKKTKGLLISAPTYRESILELEDRLVVDRELTLRLAPGACAKAPSTPAFAELCFTKKHAGKISAATAADLERMRAALRKVAGSTIVVGTLTADEVLRESDEELLDLVLNGSERTIRHVSIVARQPVAAAAAKAAFHDFSMKLPAAGTPHGVKAMPEVVSPPALAPSAETSSQAFDTKYFLTGFTWGKSVDDSWEYTIAKKNFWHGRYYVRVDWHLGFGFGVRAPFSVSVSSHGPAERKKVELAVAPVDVDAHGGPAYPAVGLPASKTFGGKEFVLDVSASCHVYASIPGPNINRGCGSVGIDESRDADPVIGEDTTTIPTWWLPGEVTGLGKSVGVVAAWIDLGVSATISNGKFGMQAAPLGGASFAEIEPGRLWFSDTSPITFDVLRSSEAADAGLRLDEPRYEVDLALTPSVRGRVEVDVGVYEKEWTIGKVSIGALKISQSLALTRHDGTVAQHDYVLFSADAAGDQPAKAKPGKAKPKAPPSSKAQPSAQLPGPNVPAGGKPLPKLPGGSKLPNAK